MAVLRILYSNRWARYALTLLLLALVVLRVNPGHLARAVLTARPQDLLIALVLTAPFLYFKSLRWHAMLDAAGIEATFSEAVISLMGGMGLALITPARIGELARAAYLHDPQKWKIGGLVMLDKGFDVLVLCGLSIAGAWILIGVWAGAAFAVLTALGLLAAHNPGRLASGLKRATAPLPGRSRINEVCASLDSLGPAHTTLFLALTLLAFGVVLLQFGIILLSWHAWSPEIVLLTFPLVVLTNIVPLTIGGLGIREGAAALLLAHYGVSSADAALAAFLMFAVNTALPGIAGSLLLPAASASRRLPSPHRP